MMTWLLRVSGVLLLLMLYGCTNNCSELAEKYCTRVGEQKDVCRPLSSADKSASEDCSRLKAAIASCSELRKLSETAGGDEQTACKAELETIRALERQQM